MPNSPITAGERFADVDSFSQRGADGPNLWRTLGFRRTAWGPGSSTVEWDATVDYGFYTPSGPVIQGGLVTAILDSAMGGACWTTLNNHEVFLTADLFTGSRNMTERLLADVLPGVRRDVRSAVRAEV